MALNAQTGEEYWKVENGDLKGWPDADLGSLRSPQGPGPRRVVGRRARFAATRPPTTSSPTGLARCSATGPETTSPSRTTSTVPTRTTARRVWHGHLGRRRLEDGGGTNWHDPETEPLPLWLGQPGARPPRPGDNKWTMTRDADTGKAHDEWDHAGVNVMTSRSRRTRRKLRKLLTHGTATASSTRSIVRTATW